MDSNVVDALKHCFVVANEVHAELVSKIEVNSDLKKAAEASDDLLVCLNQILTYLGE